MSDFYDDKEESQDLSSLSANSGYSADNDLSEDDMVHNVVPVTQNDEAEEEPPPDYDGYDDDFSDIGDDNNENGTDDDFDIEHPDEAQNRDILAADEDELSDPLKNDAFFLDRNKIILIITALVFIVLIIFLCMPQKPRAKKTDELDKAGKVYIPSEIDRWSVENILPSSASQMKDELVEDSDVHKDDESISIPGINTEQRAPVDVPQNLSQSSGRNSNEPPATNRNEQQKAFFSVPLDRSSGSGNSLHANTSNTNSRYTQGTSQVGNYLSLPQTGTQAYTPASLSSNLASYLSQQGTSSYDRQNNQSGKQSYLDKDRGQTGTYQWNSDFSLWKGTVIPAVLDTGINTDLPGQVIATVTQNIYSSNNGKYILIPQGSRLFADYNSSVSYGQNRVQVVWNTLIRPDGLEINLGSMNGVDQYGYAGYRGSVSNHPFQFMKALGLIAMFSVIDTKVANTINTSNNQYATNVMANTFSEAQKLTNKIVDRALDIQPTITIAAGEKISLITNLTMELPPLDPYLVEEKYTREY